MNPMPPTSATAPRFVRPTPPPLPASQPKDSKTHFISRTTIIALFAAVCIAGYLVARYALYVPFTQCRWLLIAVLVVGGAPLVIGLARKLFAREFGSDLLAGMSIVTSALLGEYLAGSIVVLMLSGGTALEEYATRRASSVLGALAKRMPRIAHRKRTDQLLDVDVSEIQVGEQLLVFPHEVCPADGVVLEGRGSMDESYLTGEPFLIQKVPGATVLSGALNGETVLTISVSNLPSDSRYAKIMRVMQEAEANRPQMRRIADRLGAWYTLLALGVAGLGWVLGGDPTRFLAVLVIATPCPLLLAIPVAIIGAISVAASRGIIIKDPSMLERIDTCRTVIFDKTGTLTYGRPALTDVICAPANTREQVLKMAASLEQYSKHPLAATVTNAAKREGISLAAVTEISERPGEGLNGIVDGKRLQITGRKKILTLSADLASKLPPASAGMECILLVDGDYAATLRFRDAPRKESRPFITHLSPRHHVNRILLLSGDREAEVRYLAGEVGITEVLSSHSPEQKVAVVKAEANRAKTMFVGDGINDAPAMQAATVGVAFGQHSDITAEAADAVVLEPSLSKVDELIHIGRRMRRIAMQSAVGGMAISIIGMLLAAAGYLPPVAGAVAQEVIDVAAVLNALRVVFPTDELSDDNANVPHASGFVNEMAKR
jgi:heavy metal translocating P-type ATPase